MKRSFSTIFLISTMVGILFVFVFVLKITGGIHLDNTYITLSYNPFGDKKAYFLDQFSLYLMGYVLVIFLLFTLTNVERIDKTYRKIAIDISLILSAITMTVTIVYVNSLTGVCTLSIPSLCILSIDNSEFIVWLLKSTIVVNVLYNSLIFLGLFVDLNAQRKIKLLIMFIVPYALLIISSISFANTIFNLIWLISLLVYIFIVCIVRLIEYRLKQSTAN